MVATPTKKPPPCGLKMESLPLIDMRTMTQSELYDLSLCSSSAFDLRSTNDVVIPKIDRKTFNESVGSRRQTHSRLQHNSSAAVGRRIRLPGHLRAPVTPTPNDPVIAESKSVVKHLKKLINGTETENPPTDQSKPPSTVTTQVGNGSGVPTGAADMGISGERKRKRRPKMKTEVVENGGEFRNSPTHHSQPTSTAKAEVGNSSGVPSGEAKTGTLDFSGEGERKRKRRRKEKPEVVETDGEIELDILNKNGVVVDFRALENGDEVFGEELRKRTIGLVSEEEFLGFLGSLEGKWGSTRKKRRIVDAGEFSDALPAGWKLLLALKRQQYRTSVFCRRYISPKGQEFISCKEAALFLQSYFGLDDPSQLSTQTENGVDERPAGFVQANDSVPNATPDSVLPDPTTPSAHAKELSVYGIENLVEVEVKDLFECSKCKITFDEKDNFFKHLMAFHEKTTRMYSIEENLIFKCGGRQSKVGHERFQERKKYKSEVVVHENNNIKGSEELPGAAIVQKPSKSPSPAPNEKANGGSSSPKELEVVTDPESPAANFNREAILQKEVAESSLPEVCQERFRESHMAIDEKDNLRNSGELFVEAIVQKSSGSPSRDDNQPKISRMDAFADIAHSSISECHTTEPNDKANGGSSSHKEVEVTIQETPAANADHGAILHNGAAESSLPEVEPLDCFPSFITLSEKEEHGFYKAGQNFRYTPGFEELAMAEPVNLNFSFLNGQDSAYLPDSMNLANTEGTEEGFISAARFGPETGRYQFTAECVWCQSKFSYEAVGLEAGSNSVGFMCPACKAKISGQFNMLDTGSSMNSLF